MSRWDNNYRRRYVYLLGFTGRRVYVGQTDDARRRIQEHRRFWREPFMPALVEQFIGMSADAVYREYAWRWAAHKHGWSVITLSGEPFHALADMVRPGCRDFGESRQWPFST